MFSIFLKKYQYSIFAFSYTYQILDGLMCNGSNYIFYNSYLNFGETEGVSVKERTGIFIDGRTYITRTKGSYPTTSLNTRPVSGGM